MPAKVSQTYKPMVRLTAHRGWYRVQSGSNSSVYYETSANSCTCPARKSCKHQRFVRSLNVAFFLTKKATTPAAPSTALDQRLARAYRALADAHSQDDTYATLLRRVDELERQVAADNASAMWAA